MEELKLMMLNCGKTVDFIPSSNYSRRSSFLVLQLVCVCVRGEFQRFTIQIRNRVAMLYVDMGIASQPCLLL